MQGVSLCYSIKSSITVKMMRYIYTLNQNTAHAIPSGGVVKLLLNIKNDCLYSDISKIKYKLNNKCRTPAEMIAVQSLTR